jgi:hypothetical protein
MAATRIELPHVQYELILPPRGGRDPNVEFSPWMYACSVEVHYKPNPIGCSGLRVRSRENSKSKGVVRQ